MYIEIGDSGTKVCVPEEIRSTFSSRMDGREIMANLEDMASNWPRNILAWARWTIQIIERYPFVTGLKEDGAVILKIDL